MCEPLKRRLYECGIEVEVLATSPVFCRFPQVNRAIRICKDATTGKILFVGVPETAWKFEGIVYLANGLMLLIDQQVWAEWEIGRTKGAGQ